MCDSDSESEVHRQRSSKFTQYRCVSPPVGIDVDTVTKLIEAGIERALKKHTDTIETGSGTTYDNQDKRAAMHGVNEDVVPKFDPENSEMTTEKWIAVIDQLGAVHGWSNTTKSYYMQTRLSGVAKTWHNNLQGFSKTWDEWKKELREAFPTTHDFARDIREMISYRKTICESMTRYFYKKNSLLNRCNIKGENAVSCVIDGLPLEIQGNAKAGNFKTPAELFSNFMCKFETKSPRQFGAVHDFQQRRTPYHQFRKNNRYNSPVQRCFRCDRPGHLAKNCFGRGSQSRCEQCGRKGHATEACYSSKLRMKQVNLLENKVSNELYFKQIKLNDHQYRGYIDTGSQLNVANSAILSQLNLDIEPVDFVIKGFAGQPVIPVGKAKVLLKIDNIEIETHICFVTYMLDRIDVIVGQPVINHESLKLTVNAKTVDISYVTVSNVEKDISVLPVDCIVPDSKVSIKVSDNVLVPSFSSKFVKINHEFSNNIMSLFIRPKLRFSPYQKFNLVGTVLIGNDDKLLVQNLDNKPLQLKMNDILCRGEVVTETSENYYNNKTKLSSSSSQAHLLALSPTNITTGKLSPTDYNKLNNLLNKYSMCFAAATNELGLASGIEMDIKLMSNVPVFSKPYRLPEPHRKFVRDKVNELIQAGVVRPSNSSYASPVVLVKKKSGDYRMCIDYRKLNSITVKDKYPLPHIEDQLGRLANMRYFCCLDLAQGYYQMPLSDESMEKTAFVTPDGQFEFVRVPFGLTNAPSMFQRLINNTLGELRHDKVLAYMDDILIPSNTIDDGLDLLNTVLQLFKNANLKLNLSKCNFFSTSIEYLGYEVSLDGIRPGKAKIESVIKFKIPKNVHEIRQFLGLSGYFRKFINNYSKIAEPLNKLLRKNVNWKWDSQQNESFTVLKEMLSTRPILSIYNSSLQTELHTDASKLGLAGILFQYNDGNLKPVAYFSRATNEHEQNYHSYELETLAVVESIKRFRIYLVGIPFKVVTDCSAVTHTFTKKDLVPRVARWWLSIQDYDMTVEHRPGTKMRHVDALSRNPPTVSVLNLNTYDWVLALQEQDDQIRIIKDKLTSGTAEKDIKNDFVIRDSRVYRLTQDGKQKLVIPKTARWKLLNKHHDEMGHIGLKRCDTLIKEQFWFPGMTRFIKKYVNACMDCAYKRGTYGRQEGFLHPIEKPVIPFDTIHIDHLGPFAKSNTGYSYLFLIIDSFSKFLFAKPTKTTNSREVIMHLKDIWSTFGVPKRIISDRGKAFTSNNFKEFCIKNTVKHILNSIASPRSNGQIERYNRTILDALNCSTDNECNWHNKLYDIMWGINNTVNSVTGFTPYKLMFGTERGRYGDMSQVRISECREDERKVAKQNMDKQAATMKKRFDSRRKQCHSYKKGDLVLWKDAGKQDKIVGRKLGLKYGGPYKILRILGNDRYEIIALRGMKGHKRFRAFAAVDKLRPWKSGAITETDSDSSVDSTAELVDLLEG